MVEIKVSIRATTAGDLSVSTTCGNSAEPKQVPFFDGPFTAPAPPAGPPCPPPSLTKQAPFLEQILLEGDPPQPARRDFSYRWNRGLAAWGGRMSHWVDWTDTDSRLVEGALTPPVVVELENCIKRWTWMWPDVAATVLPARHPEYLNELAARRTSDPRFRRKRDAHARNWLDTALHEGLFEVFRTRSRWPNPEAQDCAVCGRLFAPETLSHWMRRFGPPRYCVACSCRATQGCSVADAVVVTNSLRFAAKTLGCIPSQDYARGQVDLGGLNLADRDDAMAALVCFPDPGTAAAALGVSTTGRGRWLAVLQAVNLVGPAWRQARGTHSFASDGHLCRSLGERSIDDFLSANNISHEPEPAWPPHEELNPLGRLRADWKLADGTLVEYAGLIGDNAYDAKMASKHRLAQETGTRLLLLTPPDLTALSRAFAGYIADGKGLN